MKKLILLVVLFFSVASVALGEVSTRICLADGNTPWEPQDIMAGTKLTIIVDSNVAEDWAGALLIEGDHRDYAVLGERADSNYPAAGVGATVSFVEYYWDQIEKDVRGFDLYTGLLDIEQGPWFIVDYNSISAGDCNVGFYEHEVQPPFGTELLYYLEFTHVRTRDFDKSTKVDFADFAIFSLYWQESGYTDPNQCEGTDLDTDGTVGANDLLLFSDYWLVRTE